MKGIANIYSFLSVTCSNFDILEYIGSAILTRIAHPPAESCQFTRPTVTSSNTSRVLGAQTGKYYNAGKYTATGKYPTVREVDVFLRANNGGPIVCGQPLKPLKHHSTLYGTEGLKGGPLR